MALMGKLEGDVEINADATSFHDVFGNKPHHTVKASPDKIPSCDLHEGEWGGCGSIINWTYVHEGKTKIAKVKVEAIDDVNNSTTLRIIEGDLMEEFKSFVITIKATPKADGGSIVRWTLEYEKLHEGVADPESLLEFQTHLTKDIDAHLIQSASA